MNERDVVLQPIIDMSHHGLIGYELLTRLIGPNGALQSPAEHVFGTSWQSVDRYVLETVANWGRMGCQPAETLYINVSSATLIDNEIFGEWVRAFEQTLNHFTGAIAIEISEVTPTAVLQARWHVLETLGASLVIDDFGQGLAQEGRLKNFPWHTCKFEAGRLEQDRDAVCFCHRHGIRTIAEKVETPGQAKLAWELGISSLQGFLYERPQRASDVLAIEVLA